MKSFNSLFPGGWRTEVFASPSGVKTAVEDFVNTHGHRWQGGSSREALLAKVDVDNCDCCFLEALLKERPHGLNLRPMMILGCLVE